MGFQDRIYDLKLMVPVWLEIWENWLFIRTNIFTMLGFEFYELKLWVFIVLSTNWWSPSDQFFVFFLVISYEARKRQVTHGSRFRSGSEAEASWKRGEAQGSAIPGKEGFGSAAEALIPISEAPRRWVGSVALLSISNNCTISEKEESDEDMGFSLFD